MPDGIISFRTDLDNRKLEKKLSYITKKIESIERDISGNRQSKSKWEVASANLAVKLDEAKAKLYEMETAAKGVFSEEQIKTQRDAVDSLQAQWDNAQDRVEEFDRRIYSSNLRLQKQKTLAGQIGNQISANNDKVGLLDKGVGGVTKRFEELKDRISKLAARVLIFSMITTGLRSLRSWMGEVIKTNDEASAALARLKGALLTMAQPLVDVVIPAFTTLVNLLTALIGKIAAFVAMLGGKTAKDAANAAKSLNDEKKAINGLGGAAKKAGKSIASFDEINTLGGDAAGASNSSSTDIEPDFSWSDGICETLDRISDYVLLIGTGLLLWKIGDALPGELGEIATTLAWILVLIGGLLLYWDGLTDAWENGVDWVNLIEMVTGLGLAAFALYQLFGPIASGILLVAGGLAMLVTGFHDAMESGWNLQNVLLSIAGIIAMGLGITLLTGSFIPLLIAGIAALLLALTVATGHGEELIDGIQEICKGFVDFFTGIFSGDIEKALGGIESISNGLGKAVSAVIFGVRDTILSFLDWLNEKTGGKLAPIIDFVKGLFTGLFDTLATTVSGIVDGIMRVLSGLVEFLFGVFTGDWERAWDGVKDIFGGVWDGIASLLEGAINLVVKGINWLIKQINKISFTAPDWLPGVGGKTIGFNFQPIGELKLPRLAQGAVIPPNREFMAVLGDQKHGTNIEAPLETIQEAVAKVMDDYISASLAGDEAIVAVLKEILEAVYGIDTSDERYASAVDRYRQKMAVVRGGIL